MVGLLVDSMADSLVDSTEYCLVVRMAASTVARLVAMMDKMLADRTARSLVEKKAGLLVGL